MVMGNKTGRPTNEDALKKALQLAPEATMSEIVDAVEALVGSHGIHVNMESIRVLFGLPDDVTAATWMNALRQKFDTAFANPDLVIQIDGRQIIIRPRRKGSVMHCYMRKPDATGELGPRRFLEAIADPGVISARNRDSAGQSELIISPVQLPTGGIVRDGTTGVVMDDASKSAAVP